MMRKIAISWTLAAPLDALLTLHAARPRPRGGNGLVHEELRRELRRALSSLEPTLSRFTSCVAWLEKRDLVSLGRVGHALDGALALRDGALRVDLASLDASAREETRGLDGRAHATLFALRAVLRTLQRADLFTVTTARAGTRRAGFDEILREVERTARRHGFRDDDAVPARFAPSPAPAEAPPRRPGPRRTARRPSEGFGGLPDDAVSDDAPPAPPPLDPRAPSPDARFFLQAAGIEAWPCARATLDRARRAVITRLHPDRAGESGAHDFHRAIKGHAELIALLALLDASAIPTDAPAPSPATPRAPEAPEAPAAKRPRTRRVKPPAPAPAPSPAVNEWPPPPPVAVSPPSPAAPPPAPLDDDARYFLREAALSWPCAPDALRDAWRTLSARLRRMTPASEAATSFARASRGYDALLRAA